MSGSTSSITESALTGTRSSKGGPAVLLWGLAGMEERAALLGGTVTVQSRPGYGTEVEALIPHHHSGGSASNHLGVHIEEIKT